MEALWGVSDQEGHYEGKERLYSLKGLDFLICEDRHLD